MNIMIRTLAILAFSAVSAYGMMNSGASELDLNLDTNSVSTTRIVLTWEAPESGIDHFDIDRSADGFDYSPLAQVDGDLRFFSDVTVTRGEYAVYRIRACFNAACSDSSAYSIYDDTAEPVSGAEGAHHSVVLTGKGTVWARGENDKGQLGDGTNNPDSDVVYVRSENGILLHNIIAIAAGYKHSLALAADGTVWAWGENQDGQLGDGKASGNASSFAVKVLKADGSPLDNLMAVSTKDNHSLALAKDGTVWTWGNNPSGEDHTHPVQVKLANGDSLTDIVAIAAGMSHSIALKADGSVWGWGNNEGGQLGIGLWSSSETHPRRMKMESDASFLKNIIEITAGQAHTLCLDKDGRVWATGKNNHGQLGNGTTDSHYSAVQVVNVDGSPLENICDLAAGYNHSLAETNDETIMIWGNNDCGQLGDGQASGTMSVFPIPVITGPEGNIGDDVGVAVANANRSFAILKDGTFRYWGSNLYADGQEVPTGNESLFPEETEEGFNFFLLGYDVNLDNEVNVLDLVSIIKHIMGYAPLTESQKIGADVNEDGLINILDVVELRNIILDQE